MADKKGEISKSSSFPESKEININSDVVSGHDHTGGDKVGSMKPPSSLISTSKVFREQVFESTSTGSELTLFFEGDSKGFEARQSSDGIASTWPKSMKRDISTYIGLPHRIGSSEMDARRKRRNHTNAAEEGCYTMEHESQHRTESSCSNSLSALLPVKEAYTLKHCSGSMDNSDSKGSDLISEETLTASAESSVSAQIARKAIRNARSRNNAKIPSIVGSHSTLLAKISTTEGQHGGATGQSLVCSGNSDKFYCSSKTEENTRSCVEHDNHPSSYSGERMLSSEISGESGIMLAVGGKPLETEGDFVKNESFDSSKDHCTFVAGFDLNEDINTEGVEDLIQPVVENVSSHSVIHVVAKSGIPRGLPIMPLKFEGGTGWKGSSETSAFRPAFLSKSSNQKSCSRNYGTNPQSFTGIDLNVAAAEDSTSEGLHDSCSKVGNSERTESLNIDLNCLYNAEDEFTQPSLPREPENPPLMDLNLNAITSQGDKANNVHWLRQGRQPTENRTWDSRIKSEHDFNSTTNNAYWADLNTMQQGSIHAHVQQYTVAAPNILQQVELMQRVGPFSPKLPFVSHALPPHTYPFKGPFHFSSRDPLPLSVPYSCTMPNAGYSQESGTFPGLLNPGMGHSSSKADAKTEDYFSRCGSTMDEARQFPFLAQTSETGEQMKSLYEEAWYARSTKRKEPEGGLEYCRLGYRQVS